MTIRSLEFHTIQSYVIISAANGYVLGRSFSAPSPYAVWKVDDDGKGVSCGHYFVDREEAEWDFCARAFEWFEDNMYIHMIEDNTDERLEDKLLSGLKKIRADLADTARLVDEMCAEVDRLKAERRIMNENTDDQRN